jgi:DNA-binding transcriptional regulator YdaS (Cro superfamily)
MGRILGIRSQAISQWTVAPPRRALAIEAATGGRVTAAQLRPDVFGKAA